MKIAEIKPQPEYKLWLRFEDGVQGTADLSALVTEGVFTLWRDPAAFAKVRVGDFGEARWSDHVDLCPDALYELVTGRLPDDLRLLSERAHA